MPQGEDVASSRRLIRTRSRFSKVSGAGAGSAGSGGDAGHRLLSSICSGLMCNRLFQRQVRDRPARATSSCFPQLQLTRMAQRQPLEQADRAQQRLVARAATTLPENVMGLAPRQCRAGSKILLFLKKKKQKDFARTLRVMQEATGSHLQKFFGSFFQERTRFLP